MDFPNEKNLTFDGSICIKFQVNEATNKIVLNTHRLKFPKELSSYKLTQAANEIIENNNNVSYLLNSCFNYSFTENQPGKATTPYACINNKS